MTYNIAVAGKGGVGKTSLTGLLIDTLVKLKNTTKKKKNKDTLQSPMAGHAFG